MKHQIGNWQVTRNCCTSGNCFFCHGALSGKGCKRVVQANNYSQAYATYVAGHWSSYKAVAERMSAN